MKKRTKIIATVGPSSDSVETLYEMIRAGVNLFRMNFSHGTHQEHDRILANIREAIARSGLVVGILQDICGPKIRIGKLDNIFHLQSGDHIEFVKEEIIGTQVGEGHYRLSLNQPEILDKLELGNAIYLYDGVIQAIITEVGDHIIATVKNSGQLSSKKGVNFPNTPLGIEIITPKDHEDMRWGVENGVDFMAISFVQNADDMKKARTIIDSFGGKQQLIAKIEKFDAVENIDEILDASDGLMVARGDLGIEVPYYEVPAIQKRLIQKGMERGKPVITATQMLLSMTEKETATRAEISDVANAVLDGTDAVMLSEESAVGHHPVLAIQTMQNTIIATEKIYPFYLFDRFVNCNTTDIVEESMVRLAKHLDAKAIFAVTTSGTSVKKLSRYRPNKPIYAVTHSDTTARSLTLVWGVVPAFCFTPISPDASRGELLFDIIKSGIERNFIDLDSTYILTAGDPVGQSGLTNTIRILRRYEMEYFLNLFKQEK